MVGVHVLRVFADQAHENGGGTFGVCVYPINAFLQSITRKRGHQMPGRQIETCCGRLFKAQQIEPIPCQRRLGGLGDCHMPDPLQGAGGMEPFRLISNERAVEAVGRGRRGGVRVRPRAGDRGIRGDRRPVREAQVRDGLQREEEIRRGADDDGHGVVGRAGDVGKSRCLRGRHTAGVAVECNRASLGQCPAIHC